VVRAREGEQEAFRLIYQRFVRPIVHFAYDMVGQREQAEDLAQETFIRAFRNLKSLREEAKLSTWLFGIARNVCLESLRSKPMQSKKVDLDDDQVMELKDEKILPDERLLNRELSAVIQKALAALDVDKRQVFVLKFFHEHSYDEIATITGFSIPKVKTDLHRARSEMRRQIRPYLEVDYAL
jgi:RNA polymerase sigma-70 factor (ECF subfamily)